MKRNYIVSNIEWDTDGEDVQVLPVVKGITLDPEDYEGLDEEEIEESIIDFLTELYGWCISDYEIEEVFNA